MSDNKKSPDNNDISPIRGLFRQNEEAYNKHQQQVGREKERLAVKRKEQQLAEEQAEREAELFQQENASKKGEEAFGERIKSFLGKIVEIVTQPEDGYVFGEDSDGFEDIYSDEQKPVERRTEAEEYNNIQDETYDKTTDSEEETFDIGEAVIYQSSVSAEVSDSEMITEDLPQPDSENESETFEAQENAGAVTNANEENTKIHQTVENGTQRKTEITLDAIMYAKNAGAEGMPVTYTVQKRSVEPTTERQTVDNEEESAEQRIVDNGEKPAERRIVDNEKETAEQQAVDTEEETAEQQAVNTEEIPKEQQSVNIEGAEQQYAESDAEDNSKDVPERKNELAHNESSDERVTVGQERQNELSHNTNAEENIVSADKRVNELSHDINTEAKTENANIAKNELSHNTTTTNAGAIGTVQKRNNNQTNRRTDFSEGEIEPMVYKRSDSPAFVVMAGKFTKTLRAEYEDTRRLRGFDPPPKDKEKKAEFSKKPAAKSVKKSENPPAEKKNTEESIEKTQNVEANSNILHFPNQNKRKHFHIMDLFSADGDTFDEDEDTDEEIPEITDYQNKEDIAAIRNELNYNYRKRFFRTGVLGVITIVSLLLSIFPQIVPSLFTETLHNGWLMFGILNFILLAVVVFEEKSTIFYGLAPLRHFRATSDTAASVAAVAAVIQSVTGLFLPDVFVNGTYHMYSSLAILALLFNSIGKLIIIKRTADNFRFLCSPKAGYAGKIYTNKDNAQKLINGLPAQRPIIAYTKKSKLMSNFLQLSYTTDPIEDNAIFVAPFAAVLSLVCGLAYGLLAKDFVGGVSSFALTSFITSPICALIALNIPIKRLCGSTLCKGSMVVGYEAVKQFSDTNAVMIESNQLYPKGNIILSGVKAFNESKLNNALLAGAAVSFAVDGPMSHIFETIVQDRKHMLPVVESVSYDDNLGLSGWIGGQRILIGNRALMNKHNINMPDESVETKYRKLGNEISYISVSGELIAMFILTYKVDKDIAASLRDLTQKGVSIIVRTIDPNITQQHICDKFGILQRYTKVLNTGLGNVCHEEINSVEDTSRAYVVTNGKLSAFAAAVSGCMSVRSAVTIIKIIQIVSIVFGFFLVNIISFVSGFAKLGGLEILLYTVFWCVGMTVVSILARKFY